MTKKIAATCTIVFALPHQFAAMTTPCCVACMRVTVTANSRAMITIATQAASAVQRDERDERRDDQQLVGDRVHELAERRDRVARRAR